MIRLNYNLMRLLIKFGIIAIKLTPLFFFYSQLYHLIGVEPIYIVSKTVALPIKLKMILLIIILD